MYTRSGMYVGTDDFADLRLNSHLFVDKSLFIKEFLEDSGKVALITRPRRWGKSLNLDMLGRFLAIEVDQHGTPIAQEDSLNRKLFAGGEVVYEEAPQQLAPLNIATQERLMRVYQGKSPVISLGLKEVKGSSYEEVVKGVKLALCNVFKKHIYLLQEGVEEFDLKVFKKYLKQEVSIVETKNGLLFLSELLYKHFGQPVYILIDEYDTPINHAYLTLHRNTTAFDKVLGLFRQFFGEVFKTNPYLAKGFITGILRIAKANIFSDLNNLTEYTLLDRRFATSYGFTQAEVDGLLAQTAISTSREEIRQWYNGYTFGGEVIYNPWSIMFCLGNDGELDHYWIDSGGTALIDAVLEDELQEDLQLLFQGQSIDRVIAKKIVFEELDNPDSLLTLLLFCGYLNPTAIDAPRNFYRLSVPNYEVSYIYEKRIIAWIGKKLHISSKEYVKLADLLVKGKLEAFQQTLQQFLDQAASFQHTGGAAEVFYNGFMLAFLSMLSSYYRIESEYESGVGKADVMLIPKSSSNHQALILEYKVSKEVEELPDTAKAGLAQLLAKDYAAKARLEAHVQSILAVSLAFCGKQVAMKYEMIPKQ